MGVEKKDSPHSRPIKNQLPQWETLGTGVQYGVDEQILDEPATKPKPEVSERDSVQQGETYHSY